MKEIESIFFPADMSVEVWDQANGQKHVLLTRKSVFNLHSHSDLANKCNINPANLCFVCMSFCGKRTKFFFCSFFVMRTIACFVSVVIG